MAKQSRLISNKFLMGILIGLLTALFGGVGVMYYLGMYTQVRVERITAPAYRIAYRMHIGPYDKIESTIKQVGAILRQAGGKPGDPCALFLDDVGKVPAGKRRSKVGYLVGRNDYVPSPLVAETIPAREVVRVMFRGGRLLGSFKAYKAMRSWARANGYKLILPALEIYHRHGPTEYQLGIRKEAKSAS